MVMSSLLSRTFFFNAKTLIEVLLLSRAYFNLFAFQLDQCGLLQWLVVPTC